METEAFLAQLDKLIEAGESSKDVLPQKSVIVLLALRGAFTAGDDFLDAFVDHTVVIAKNQRDVLILMQG